MHRVRSRRSLGLALSLATLLVLSACADKGDDKGSDASSTSSASSGSTDTSAPAGELGRGVTDDTIKVGIAIVDYGCAVKDYVDFVRGDQEQTAKIVIDDINANGGVGGRMLDPVFRDYCPVPGQEPSANTLCTQFAQDDEVFAVIGAFIDITGQAHKCLSGDNQVVTIASELQEAWMLDSAGLLLTSGGTPEARATQMANALAADGRLEGQTVAVIADQDGEARVSDVIRPALEGGGATLGSDAILPLGTTDTSAAQAQLDASIQRWMSEGVTALFLSGLQVSDKQFVQKIKDQMPEVQLYADSDMVVSMAQDMVAQGVDPNPYEGLISATGLTAAQRWADKNELLQACVDTWEGVTGETIKAPGEEDTNADGDVIEIHIAVNDYCGDITMFKLIAERVGPTLNNDNWVATVNRFGDFAIPQGDLMSLCEGKYSADDAAQLVEFDSTAGTAGDWKSITDIVDANDDCAEFTQ